jgi:hypothetical protein
MNELEEPKLEVKALFLAVVEVVKGSQDDLEVAGELFFSEQQGSTGGAGALVTGDLEELSLFAAEAGHEGVAQVADELTGEGTGAVAGVEEHVELGHQFGGTAGRDRFKDALEDGVGDRTHEIANLVSGKDGAASFDGRRGNGLIHDGQRVAHGTVTGFSEEGERIVLGGDLLVTRDHAKLGEDVVELDGMKAEVLAARADGLGNVFRLGGGHHEDDVGRRLLKSLEQRVEGGLSDLVGLVEDVDLVSIPAGRVAGGVAEFSNLVYAAIGGGVNLDDVDGVALSDFNA